MCLHCVALHVTGGRDGLVGESIPLLKEQADGSSNVRLELLDGALREGVRNNLSEAEVDQRSAPSIASDPAWRTLRLRVC